MGEWRIVGAGAQGRILVELLARAAPGDRVVLLDDAVPLRGTEILGARVVGPVAALAEPGDFQALIAIGNNPIRLQLAARFPDAPYSIAIHPTAFVSASARLGPGTVVFPGAVVHTGAELGAQVVVNTGAIVEHDCVLEDGASISPGARMGGRVFVGRGAFVSTGVTLAPRVRVGRGAVIGAGAVVVQDIPENVLAFGVPARVVKTLDDGFDWRRLL